MKKYTIVALVMVLMVPTMLFAQKENEKEETIENPKDTLINWHLRNFTDSIRGTNIEKVYKEILVNKQPKDTILVAVIDSGIDIDHEDLRDLIWTNDDEIPENGIDDDNNGYVDDVNGWNYLGNADGDMVGNDNLEVSRLYKKLSAKWEGKTASEIKEDNLEEWKYYQKVKNEFEEGKLKAEKMQERYNGFMQMYSSANDLLTDTLGTDYSSEQLDTISFEDEKLTQAKGFMLNVQANGIDEAYLERWADYIDKQVNWYYNPDVDVRRDIIQDDPNNLYEKGYGNNKVSGVEPNHGTHVAGIIGAIRNNGIGIDGVANAIRIMPIRTVPGGDEHDKDVANAIRYAVDNGARVVNMSFGKSFSPNEKLVAEAIQYAEDNDVLLVHAAGNDGADVDETDNFPTNYSDYIKGKVKTYLTVGASSIHAGKEFPATFSNYGNEKVDIFAPGVDIYSTYPDDTYEYNNGTSMAAPVVSGVAALILSYHPDLKAKQVKKILEKTATQLEDELVYLPGTGGLDDNGMEKPKEEIEFKELARTAGLINAYEALKMAAKKSKY